MSRLTGLRPPSDLAEEAVRRFIEAARADLEIDPLFRHRLRGRIVNRFVAQREGIAVPGRLPRRMGRLGRSVLYASFALGVTVSSVMAASQEAVPGDLLYPLKRQIESLRHAALPPSFDDDLRAHELAARISELGALASRGDSAGVTVLADEVRRGHAAYRAAARGSSVAGDHQAAVLTALLGQLPDSARSAVADVLADLDAAARPGRGSDGPHRGSGSTPGGNGSGSSGDGHSNGGASQGGGRGHGPPPAGSPDPASVEPNRTPRPRSSPGSGHEPQATPGVDRQR